MARVLEGAMLDAERSLEDLYERHRNDVYRFVLRDVGSHEEAEDVTQAAFLNAFRALDRGERPEQPRAWLFTIARNVTRRRFRTRARRPREVRLETDLVAAPASEGGPSAADI